MHKITSALAALALTACSVHVDSQYGLRLEPRRVVRPEAEPASPTEAHRAEQAAVPTQDNHKELLLESEPIVAPEALKESTLFATESNDRWAIEVPREELPPMVQPLVDQLADRHAVPTIAPQSKGNVAKTAGKVGLVLVGIALILCSLVAIIVSGFYWLINQVIWDADRSARSQQLLIAALAMFVGAIVCFLVKV
jgi:hypothetical protein